MSNYNQQYPPHQQQQQQQQSPQYQYAQGQPPPLAKKTMYSLPARPAVPRMVPQPGVHPGSLMLAPSAHPATNLPSSAQSTTSSIKSYGIGGGSTHAPHPLALPNRQNPLRSPEVREHSRGASKTRRAKTKSHASDGEESDEEEDDEDEDDEDEDDNSDGNSGDELYGNGDDSGTEQEYDEDEDDNEDVDDEEDKRSVSQASTVSSSSRSGRSQGSRSRRRSGTKKHAPPTTTTTSTSQQKKSEPGGSGSASVAARSKASHSSRGSSVGPASRQSSSSAGKRGTTPGRDSSSTKPKPGQRYDPPPTDYYGDDTVHLKPDEQLAVLDVGVDDATPRRHAASVPLRKHRLDPRELTGMEAVGYRTEESFSVLLDVMARWESRQGIESTKWVTIPGKILHKLALQQCESLYADALTRVDSTGGSAEMKVMQRWFPYRVDLVHAVSKNIPVPWGVMWANATVYRHNMRKWGVCPNDYEKPKKEYPENDNPYLMNFLYISRNHTLHHTYSPSPELRLSDMSHVMQSNSFRLPIIDLRGELDRSTRYIRPGVYPGTNDQVNLIQVMVHSEVGRVLKSTGVFVQWLADRAKDGRGPHIVHLLNPIQDPLDSRVQEVPWFDEVPEPVLQVAIDIMEQCRLTFSGYTGFLDDQIFAFMPLSQKPRGYVDPYSTSDPGKTLGKEQLEAAIRSDPYSPSTLSGQNTADYVIPFHEYDMARAASEAPAELAVTLRLTICPAFPLSKEQAAKVGRMTLVDPGTSRSQGSPAPASINSVPHN